MSSTCFNPSERWVSFGIYAFITLVYIGIRYTNYRRGNDMNATTVIYDFDKSRKTYSNLEV